MYTTKYYSDDQTQNKETGKKCINVWGEERCLQGCGGEARGKQTTEDLGVDGKIILKWLFKTCVGRELD
jgi:hypothetical protein